MKKNSIIILAISLFCLSTSSCILMTDMATEMYWNMDDPAPIDPDVMLDTLCIIKYSIAGKTDQSVIHNQSDLDLFLYRILTNAKSTPCTLVQSSHSNGQESILAFSDQPEIKFSSTDANKVKEWAKKMLLKGYQVEILYDKRSKTYHCTAREKQKTH